MGPVSPDKPHTAAAAGRWKANGPHGPLSQHPGMHSTQHARSVQRGSLSTPLAVKCTTCVRKNGPWSPASLYLRRLVRFLRIEPDRAQAGLACADIDATRRHWCNLHASLPHQTARQTDSVTIPSCCTVLRVRRNAGSGPAVGVVSVVDWQHRCGRLRAYGTR